MHESSVKKSITCIHYMMSSICSKKAADDVVVLYDPTVQTRYVNLQKWAESDAEFVKRVTNGVHKLPHPTVVDSVSCRQMYLRSYTFSKKKKSMSEKTKTCFTKIKEQVVTYSKKITNVKSEEDKKDEEMKRKKRLSSGLAALSTFRYFTKRLAEEKKMMNKGVKRRAATARLGGGFCLRRLACVSRVREVSCVVLLSLFRRLFYCTTKVDVVA